MKRVIIGMLLLIACMSGWGQEWSAQENSEVNLHYYLSPYLEAGTNADTEAMRKRFAGYIWGSALSGVGYLAGTIVGSVILLDSFNQPLENRTQGLVGGLIVIGLSQLFTIPVIVFAVLADMEHQNIYMSGNRTDSFKASQ